VSWSRYWFDRSFNIAFRRTVGGVLRKPVGVSRPPAPVFPKSYCTTPPRLQVVCLLSCLVLRLQCLPLGLCEVTGTSIASVSRPRLQSWCLSSLQAGRQEQHCVRRYGRECTSRGRCHREVGFDAFRPASRSRRKARSVRHRPIQPRSPECEAGAASL
jgi:hypothetical protein